MYKYLERNNIQINLSLLSLILNVSNSQKQPLGQHVPQVGNPWSKARNKTAL